MLSPLVARSGLWLLLLGLMSASPAWAQTDVAAGGLATAQKPPAAPGGTVNAPAPAPAGPDLRARTRNFEPGRFNLSMEGGVGLIRAISPHVLTKWELAGSASVLNFDRNPGDVDVFEYGWQVAAGLPGRVEVFFRGAPILRTNSVNQDPVGYPVPPLDLFVDLYPTDASRAQPHFLFAQEVPYKSYYVYRVRRIEPPGHGAFASSSGDYVFGGKINLFSEDRNDPISFGLRGYLEIPSEQPRYNHEDWHLLAGVSGEIDIGVDALVAHRVPWGDVIVNVGYKHVGDPDRGLRVQYVDSSLWDTVTPGGTPASILVGEPTEVELGLRDHVNATIGTAFQVVNLNGMRFFLMPELSYTRYVAGATPVERLVHPVEMRIGIQANVPKFPSISIGAAWQLLFNDAGDGDTRRSPFVTPDGRGDINFGHNVDAELADTYRALFEARGVVFTEGSSRMFSTNNPRFDTVRNVPTTDLPVVGQGGGNILAFLTWRVR